MDKKETILTKTFDFIKEIIKMINTFPRDQRHILGTRLENLCLETFELFIEAFYLPKEQKKAKIQQANLNLEKIRFFIRMGYELGYYNSLKYSLFAEKLQEIGKMAGGWLRSLEN